MNDRHRDSTSAHAGKAETQHTFSGSFTATCESVCAQFQDKTHHTATDRDFISWACDSKPSAFLLTSPNLVRRGGTASRLIRRAPCITNFVGKRRPPGALIFILSQRSSAASSPRWRRRIYMAGVAFDFLLGVVAFSRCRLVHGTTLSPLSPSKDPR